jgi:site-specific DNA recombinase
MIEAAYFDVKQTRSIIAIKPKPPFIPIFKVAVSRKESDIRIINEPLKTPSKVPSVFLVETREAWNPSHRNILSLIIHRQALAAKIRLDNC